MPTGALLAVRAFSIANFAFFTLPHFVQRTYAARDLRFFPSDCTVVYALCGDVYWNFRRSNFGE
jgi:hypothetical protein